MNKIVGKIHYFFLKRYHIPFIQGDSDCSYQDIPHFPFFMETLVQINIFDPEISFNKGN